MKTERVVEFVRTKWLAVANIGDVVPGGLEEERTLHDASPYAVFRVTLIDSDYQTDGGRAGVYLLSLDVFSENPDDDSLDDVGDALETFTDSLNPGGAVPGGGVLCFAWFITPGEPSFQTDQARMKGGDVQIQRLGLQLRVQWT